MKRLYLVAVSTFVMAADTIIPSKGTDLSLTIYNNDRVFVHEIRHTRIPPGRQRLIYQNVPSSLITASVVPGFKGPSVTLYSQNYVYDLVNLPAMLKKSVGRSVSFYPNGKNPPLSKGVLLSAQNPVIVREQKSGRIIALEKPTQVVFPSVPPNMITRPSLIWNIETAEGGDLTVDLKYLGTGIRWKSDYVLDLRSKEKSMDLVGWITVDNRSGVSYPDARITCLAGEVHTAATPRKNRVLYKAMAEAVAAPEVKEEAFSGYHIYKIPFRETIADKEQKQIRFLEKRSVGYESYGRAQVASFPRKGVQKLRFLNTLRFANTRANGMGIPLPAGIVRMYSTDNEGQTHFIGESRLGNIPPNEPVTLTIGTLFDATGEKRTTKYVAREGYRNVVSTYTLNNRGKTPLTLKVEERIPTFGGTVRLKSSCKGPCSVKKISAFVREFTVKLPPQKSYSFTSEFEVIR